MAQLNFPWETTAEDIVTTLDGISAFRYTEGIGQIFRRNVSPENIDTPVIGPEGQFLKYLNVSLDFGNLEVSSEQSQTAQCQVYLHPLLIRFVRGNGPRAIFLGKREDDQFDIKIFEGIPQKTSSRKGYPKLYYHRYLYCAPYNVPQIEDELNELGFRFYEHSDLQNGFPIGPSPRSTIVGLRGYLEREVIQCKEKSGILATLPDFTRDDKREVDFGYMDIYIKQDKE
jgi:hypothetical protein